jgi:hypothetical protein
MNLINQGLWSVARKLGFSGESPYRFLVYQKRMDAAPMYDCKTILKMSR